MKKMDETMQRELINEINTESKEYSYQVREWDVETIYNKFWWDMTDSDDQSSETEIFIPTYQRNLTWDQKKQSRFIESLFLNLPIPFVFFNRATEEWLYNNSVLEVIDWSQRVRTISKFKRNGLKLTGLKYLTKLNWLKYNDLPIWLQKKLNLTPFRAVLFEGLGTDKRKEMFNRINTSSDDLKSMEVRKWTYEWPFYLLLKELSETQLFQELCPLSKWKINREEWTELVLRYFAYTENYENYSGNVQDFLDEFMKKKSEQLHEDALILENTKTEMRKSFINMLNFVQAHFPNWFRKSKEAKLAASRVFFESIAVWVGLAQKENIELYTEWINQLLSSDTYKIIISSDSANNPDKFKKRIEIIKEYLLTWNYDRFIEWNWQ